MRMSLVVLALCLLSCGTKTSGSCSICPIAKFVDLAACAEEGKKAGCAKAEIVEVTDDRCGAGEPPQTHAVCVYSDCDRNLNCDAVVQY